MRNRATEWLAIAVAAALALFMLRNVPLLANRDDFLRLYCGGAMGCAMLRGGGEAPALQAALARTADEFADEYSRSRFLAAQTPYSPLTLGLVCVGERIRKDAGHVDLATWALGAQTLTWLAVLATAAAVVWRVLGRAGLAAFVAAGLCLAWVHVHTSPLLPPPRCMAMLGTAIGLALLLTGRAEAWAHTWLAMAALAHPYNQALNLAVAGAAALLLRGTPAAAGWRDRSALRVAATATATLTFGLVIVRAANPRGQVAVGEMLALGTSEVWANWSANRGTVYRLLLLLGVALTAAVLRLAGPRRAAGMAVLFAASVTLPSLVWPGGPYPGEISNRVGGAWAGVVFALALRGDLLPPIDHLRPRLARVVALGIAAAAAAGAVPEVLGIRNAPHYAPWLRPPRVEAAPGVERECLALIERMSRP